VVRNTGTVDLTDLQITEDLDDHFGAAFARIAAGGDPQFTGSTATTRPTIDASWDGNEGGAGVSTLFTPAASLLRPGEEFTIRFTIELDIDQLTTTSGNQVLVEADYDATPGVAGNNGSVSDLSDTGADPAGTNPGVPGDSGGFDDVTLIPAIGVAKQHGDASPQGESFTLPVTIVVENLGSTRLGSLELYEDLADQLGSAFVSVSDIVIDASGVAGARPGVNADWAGDTSLNLLDGAGELAPGEQFTVTFNVLIDPDATGTSGALQNQALVRGGDPLNPAAVVEDLSDSGLDPSDTNPGEPGDTGTAEDATPVYLPDAGLAKRIVSATQSGLEYNILLELVFENTGTLELDNLQLIDDLLAEYGANFSKIGSPPTIVASTATVTPGLNPGFLGDTSQNIFDGTGLLRQGESITVQLGVVLKPAPGQSQATVLNQAQAGGSALDENGAPLLDSGGEPVTVLDLSDDGSNPNTTNGAGGASDPTPFSLTFFSFDSFNDLSNGNKNLWGRDTDNPSGYTNRLLSQMISSLAPEPVFSGSARPGTQITGRIYDSNGILVGEAMSVADVGGNWMMQFHEMASLDHARFEFEEVAGSAGTFAPGGDIYGYLGDDSENNNYGALEPYTSYDAQFEFTAIYRGAANSWLSRAHRVNSNPVGFGDAASHS